jgi:hypothetical protein
MFWIGFVVGAVMVVVIALGSVYVYKKYISK